MVGVVADVERESSSLVGVYIVGSWFPQIFKTDRTLVYLLSIAEIK